MKNFYHFLFLLIFLGISNNYSQDNYAFWHNTATACFQINDNAVLDVTGDFTLEAWIKPPATVSDGGTFYIAERSGVFRFYTVVSSPNLVARFDLTSGGSTISTTALGLNTWNHVAISRSGTTTRIFLNGTEVTSFNLALVASTTPVYIGGASSFFALKKTVIDEVRFSNIARYTSNFTVDPSSASLGSDANTIFYFDFNNTSEIPPADKGPNSLSLTNGKAGVSLVTSSNYLLENSLLPVSLTSFTASTFKSSVVLNWTTATEVNNYGFDILRQAQDDKWEKIGFVAGHGNSNSPKDYSFTDNNAPKGELKYRLKQVDTDGSYTYSEVVIVDNALAKTFKLYAAYPNPFNPSTKIKFSIPSSSNVSLKIYDVIGNEVASLVNERKEAGEYEVEFNASNLPSGIYFSTLQSGNGIQTQKLLLIK